MEGTAMGASIAGPYGAGGGLIVGLITGLFTADAHYKQLDDRVKAEEDKDKQLEAQLKKEIERQRQLEQELEKQMSGTEPKGKEDKHQGDESAALETALRDRAESKSKEQTESPGKDQDENSGRESDEEPIGSLANLGTRNDRPQVQAKPAVSGDTKKEAANQPTVRDVNKDGFMDLWIYYDPVEPTWIQRQEEDTDWDGTVDTWSYFTAGKLLRREMDTNRDGTADRWFFYDNEALVREERDRGRDGTPAFRALYIKGRLAKVEKDLNKDGKMDLWVTYDPEQADEVIVQEEQDLNGNGSVDIWSFYEGGRLARRDVSSVGLEHMIKHEKSLADPNGKTPPKS